MRYTDHDQFADIYNRRRGGFARNVAEPLDRLGLAAVLLERGLRVTGVDGSAEMIALGAR